MAASLTRVAVLLNVQQHGEISIIHFTFILVLLLPCLFWRYPLFQCVYKSSTHLFWFSSLFIVFMSVYPYLLFETQLIRMCVLNITVWREVFEKFSTYKTIFSKVSDLSFTSIYFSIEANTKFPDKQLP